MSDPANVASCRLVSLPEYEEAYLLTDKTVTPIATEASVPLRFLINFPVAIPDKAQMVFSVFNPSGGGDLVSYAGLARRKMDIEILFPNRPDNGYPNGGYLSVTLFLPEQLTICNWGLEDLLRLENAEHPRAFQLDLRSDVYEDADGAQRNIDVTAR